MILWVDTCNVCHSNFRNKDVHGEFQGILHILHLLNHVNKDGKFLVCQVISKHGKYEMHIYIIVLYTKNTSSISCVQYTDFIAYAK